jgi:nicotinate phosphoribosyltransferase
VFGERSVFLIDTYDTVAAARKIVESGMCPSAVRLDSGDLVALSREVRAVLDAGGLHDTKILASGDLDEWSVAEVLAKGAPIDAFGVGTALATSKDAPALGGVYKLVEIERNGAPVPVMKLSAGGKSSHPGRKQYWRIYRQGAAVGDVIGLTDEPAPPGGTPLLVPVLERGFRLGPPIGLPSSRARCERMLTELPEGVRPLEPREAYPVSRSAVLDALTDRTVAALDVMTGRASAD